LRRKRSRRRRRRRKIVADGRVADVEDSIGGPRGPKNIVCCLCGTSNKKTK